MPSWLPPRPIPIASAGSPSASSCSQCFLAGALVHVTIQRSIAQPLRDVAGRLETSTGHVALASDQLANSSDMLARNATHQAASLQQTSASSEEVTSMARRNADHASQVAGMMQESGRNFSDIDSRSPTTGQRS